MSIKKDALDHEMVECEDCSGTGDQECKCCMGSGIDACDTCDGSGEVEEETN